MPNKSKWLRGLMPNTCRPPVTNALYKQDKHKIRRWRRRRKRRGRRGRRRKQREGGKEVVVKEYKKEPNELGVEL